MSESTKATPVLRLTHFRVEHGVIGRGPPFHSMSLIDVDQPDGRLVGWSIQIRGVQVFFLSPPGWEQGQNEHMRPGKGETTVIGPIPLLHVTCLWKGDPSLIDKLQRYDHPPMQRAITAVSVDRSIAMDAKEMGDA